MRESAKNFVLVTNLFTLAIQMRQQKIHLQHSPPQANLTKPLQIKETGLLDLDFVDLGSLPV